MGLLSVPQAIPQDKLGKFFIELVEVMLLLLADDQKINRDVFIINKSVVIMNKCINNEPLNIFFLMILPIFNSIFKKYY